VTGSCHDLISDPIPALV